MKTRERLCIAAEAFLKTLNRYLFTIFFVPLIGLLAYGKIEGFGLFVIGVFSGYIQAFVEEYAKNYSKLKDEARKSTSVETRAALATADDPREKLSQSKRAPANKERTSWSLNTRKHALIILRATSRAGLILLILLLLWNLFLIFYKR